MGCRDAGLERPGRIRTAAEDQRPRGHLARRRARAVHLLLFVGAIVAIVSGHIARVRSSARTATEGGQGLALAGMILGYIGLALTILAASASPCSSCFFGDDIDASTLR